VALSVYSVTIMFHYNNNIVMLCAFSIDQHLSKLILATSHCI